MTTLYLIRFVEIFFQVYLLMLFARIICSWIPELYENRFFQFISFYTDPYLNLFRRFIPPLGMIDISPIVAFFCLSFIERFIKYLIIVVANVFTNSF